MFATKEFFFIPFSWCLGAFVARRKKGTNMSAYVYQNKTLHICRYRRKGDGTPTAPGPQGTSYDRRRPKIIQGIILVDFDRRQKDDPYYSGHERRSGVDRRNGMDRRLSVGW